MAQSLTAQGVDSDPAAPSTAARPGHAADAARRFDEAGLLGAGEDRHGANYVDPVGRGPLRREGDVYVRLGDAGGEPVARVRGRVVDFIGGETYAESFSYQWLNTDTLRGRDDATRAAHFREMDLRTGFGPGDLAGMRCLEVGAGLGDDTAYLLARGAARVDAIDLSRSIERAAEVIDDGRVRFARADVNALPFAERSFDLVVCHRMMMHTPHPAATLARVAKMVRPGGLLFVHSYHKSRYFEKTAKYKYRPLTTRMPKPLLWHALRLSAPALRGLTRAMERLPFVDGVELAREWSPWALKGAHTVEGLDERTVRRWETLVTFDSLTPRYDLPMYSRDFRDLIEAMGFSIERIEDRPWFPLWATARRVGDAIGQRNAA